MDGHGKGGMCKKVIDLSQDGVEGANGELVHRRRAGYFEIHPQKVRKTKITRAISEASVLYLCNIASIICQESDGTP